MHTPNRPSRHRVVAFAALAIALCSGFAGAQAENENGPINHLGGGPLPKNETACVSAEQELEIERQVEQFRQENPGYLDRLEQFRNGCEQPPFTFYPVAGTFGQDLIMTNWVDLQTGSGRLDWNCTQITYDGHKGHDATINGFAAQAMGVPIFAAKDGIVVVRADGHPDMNTGPNNQNQPSNLVVIDHGGFTTTYLHMKLGSVSVNLNDYVRAGQQIGLVGSSGYSSGPHLHFETKVNSQSIEPHAGPCRDGCSWWTDQVGPHMETFVLDFSFSRTDLWTVSPPPWPTPRDNQKVLADQTTYFWMIVGNSPANGTWQTKFYRPDGTLGFDSGVRTYVAPYFRWDWWRFRWNLPELRTIPGTWRMQFFINGQLRIDSPLEVVSAYNTNFNRPPKLIGVEFEPTYPRAGEVLICKVLTNLISRDLDNDLIRYRYQWTVNGEIVRDIVSAALTDVLAVGSFEQGDAVRCQVTPNDGKVDGATVSAEAPYCLGDSDLDLNVTFNDITITLANFGRSYPLGVPAPGDSDGDRVVTFNDITIVLANFGASCM